MALNYLLGFESINDINTIGNVTSAGLAFPALKIAQQTLDLSRETLAEIDRNDEWARRNEELHMQLLSEIVTLLKGIDKKLS